MEGKRDKGFIVTCAIYTFVLVAFVLLRIFVSIGMFNKISEAASDVLFSVLAQVIIMFAIPVLLFTRYLKKRQSPQMTFAEFTATPEGALPVGGNAFSQWGFKKTRASTFAWAVLLGLLLFLFNIFVSSFFNGILALFGHRGAAGGGGDSNFFGVWGLFVALLLTAVLPGLCEETAHRGLLMRGFAARLGIMRAVWLAALLFGLMHLNIVQCFYAIVLGYLMGIAVYATRTIWTAVIMHFMNNAIGVYLGFAHDNGWFGGHLMSDLGNFLGNVSFLFYVAFFVAVYFAIVAIIHKLARDNFIRDHKNDEGGPRLHPRRGMTAVKYYITYGEKRERQPLGALERTLICGVTFLGIVITGMTLVWGFL